MKKLYLCLSLCLMSLLSFNEIHAQESEAVVSDMKVITIQSDLNNIEETHDKVEQMFQKYGNNIIVEVLDTNNLSEQEFNNLLYLKAGNWVTNRRSYFIGHITYATEGILTCYVNGNSVSQCSGKVNVYGNGITFKRKIIQNGTTRSASLYWELGVGTATLGYRTPLFD